MIKINRNPSDRDLRLFAVIGAVLLLAFSLWLHFEGTHAGWSSALRLIGLLLALIGIVRPGLLKSVYVGWMLAVAPLGWLIGHGLLALVYFGVVTPVGGVLRLLGHDPLQRRSDRRSTSAWHQRKTQCATSDYFRQY